MTWQPWFGAAPNLPKAEYPSFNRGNPEVFFGEIGFEAILERGVLVGETQRFRLQVIPRPKRAV